MPLEINRNVIIKRDKDGVIRLLRHRFEPYYAKALAYPTPQQIAASYLHDVVEIYNIDRDWLEYINQQFTESFKDEDPRLKFALLKKTLNSTVISYVQTHFGLPIWQAGFRVHMYGDPLRVSSSQSTIHHKIVVKKPDTNAKFMPQSDSIKDILNKLAKDAGGEFVKINKMRLLIYQFKSDDRFHPEVREKKKGTIPFEEPPPVLPLLDVGNTIEDGTHYIVTEVLFTLKLPKYNEVNWRAFIHVETGDILYLRAFVSSISGFVFTGDVFIGDRGVIIDPSLPANTLDPLRTAVTLLGLTPPALIGQRQDLVGDYVELSETDLPNIQPPTVTRPTGAFSYSAVTDDFSAVNAYHHLDDLYRMVEILGFTIFTYFNGTTFPVPVDHRGFNGNVNAAAHGNTTGDGMGRFRFGLIDSSEPVGIASDIRVVLHEFGHTILWDNLHSPNFGFAHSMGDTLAAVLNDPGNTATDRCMTFPWEGLDRRHDRTIANGWGWGGTQDNGGYDSEQILSTTLFRFYCSIGGDSDKIGIQRLAARWTIYLILEGVSSLATNPITTTNDPEVFADALMDADIDTLDFEGIPGGALHKVIRWAFEKQGLFQPVGSAGPTLLPGEPPEVDVYIDDGRNGEYTYKRNFWNTQNIWNRHNNDGETTHQAPIVGRRNFLYVRIKNRGTQSADNIVVRVYHSLPATGLTWPDDWQFMDTPTITLPNPLAPNDQIVVGPFKWSPESVGHECILATVSADGDQDNTQIISRSIPHSRLVPFDNNIAQRNVTPITAGLGLNKFVLACKSLSFWVFNPLDKSAKIKITTKLPKFLKDAEWRVVFRNRGGSKFTLGPRDKKEINFSILPGDNFAFIDIRGERITKPILSHDLIEDILGKKPRILEIHVLIDGIINGGMTYIIDPKLR